MKNLKVALTNCFGIKSLQYDFNFEEEKTYVIYAPNGVMKSSFAKTMNCIASDDKKKVPKDNLFVDRITKYEILSDGNPIDPSSICVADTNISIDSSSKVTTLLATKELKEQYDKIFEDLDNKKIELLKKIKILAQSTDCEDEFTEAFKNERINDFYSCLLSQEDNINENYRLYEFKYNTVFDKDGKIKDFVSKNGNLLNKYIEEYTKLLGESVLFKKALDNGVNFGTYQAKQLLDSVKDGSFFGAMHKIVLSNEQEVNNQEKFSELFVNEINKILSDEKLKKTFEKIDNSLGKNENLREFKILIEKFPDIIPSLVDYESFRKEVLLGYFSKERQLSMELINLYKNKKKEIETLLEKAGKQQERWNKIIKLYNERFFVPFTVEIENQEDIILKLETAHLNFIYKDEYAGKEIIVDRSKLKDVLSTGERRAFNMLQLLFDIESRKIDGKDNIIIYDDIADSFDYKNKFAIIEYINDLKKYSNFYQIILTHNFDFYRTLGSRLNLKKTLRMAYHDKDGNVVIEKSGFTKDYFNNSLFNKVSNEIAFVGIIPVARNLIEYVNGQDSDYMKLTSCLHLKRDTDNITAGDILKIYHKFIFSTKKESITFGNENIKVVILKQAQDICKKDDIKEIDLQDKLALSIAIRLKAEEYMINRINDMDFVNGISNDQTKVLYDKFKEIYPNDAALSVLEEVNMMTPMNIHFNAFMYEPLIDVSILNLRDLYCKIDKLVSVHE